MDRRKFGKLFLPVASGFSFSTLSESVALAQNREDSGEDDLDRIALLIGNQNYRGAFDALSSPIQDVDDVAHELSILGFNFVTQPLKDATYEQMKNAIDKFEIEIKKGKKFAFFYYSGHGGEISGSAYLIPLDSKNENTGEPKFISISEVGEKMNQTSGYSVLLLDSCRTDIPSGRVNYPQTKGVRRLSNFNSLPFNSPGQVTLYAAGPNQVAIDQIGWDRNRNSLFTRYFLDELRKRPNQTIKQLFNNVVSRVSITTGDAVQPTFQPSENLPRLSFSRQNTSFLSRRNSSSVVERTEVGSKCAPLDFGCQQKMEPSAPVSVHKK